MGRQPARPSLKRARSTPAEETAPARAAAASPASAHLGILPTHSLSSLRIRPSAPDPDRRQSEAKRGRADESGNYRFGYGSPQASDSEDAQSEADEPMHGVDDDADDGAGEHEVAAAAPPRPAVFRQTLLRPLPAHAAVPAIAVRPAPARFRQAHLGPRANPAVATARRAQLIAAGAPLPKRISDAALAVTELHDYEHGRGASAANPGRSAFKRAYRQRAAAHNDDSGGSGLDEMVSTSVTADFRARLALHLPNAAIDHLVGRMSEARRPTHELTWAHDTGVAAPAAAPPYILAGHPGSVSKSATDMRQGITAEHGTRNEARAAALETQFAADLPLIAAAGPGAARTAAANAMARNVGIIGSAYTVRHMMEPAPRLNLVNAGSAQNSYSAKYGPLIENHARMPGFATMVRANHNAREELKIHSADRLRLAGHESLIHPDMSAHLAASDNDPNQAVQALHARQNNPPPSTQLHASFPAAPMSLAAMTAHNAANPPAAHMHLIGPPRGMIR